jgi:serine-type D-Ala-D-Ala carboxypeptidase (penicillin-binding protein 5/6)
VTGRPALTLCAATLTATAVLTASPVAQARAGAVGPLRDVSTVGGVRLGDAGTQVDSGPGVPALPDMTAKSWMISDLDSGEVLASHNAHLQLPPASTLKMLFADTLINKFPKTETHVVQPSDLDGMGAGSSLVGVVPHLSYSVADLWRGVFLRSGNDAVHVLASMNGGVADTVADMQDKADDLRAYDTHVVTPDGYDEPGQVSSAYDLSLFARAGLNNPDFRDYCSTVSAQFPGDYKGGDRDSFAIQNTDRLLAGDPAAGLKPYPGIQGVKNGYTTNAGNTYTVLADRDGVRLLVTVMHPKAGGDEVYKEAAALLDWGFKADGDVQPVGDLVSPKVVPENSVDDDGTQPAGGSDGQGQNQGQGQAKGHDSGKAAPKPTVRHGHPATAAVSSSGSGGMWTAAGITAGVLAVLAAASLVVRRRWPNPAVIRRRRRP